MKVCDLIQFLQALPDQDMRVVLESEVSFIGEDIEGVVEAEHESEMSYVLTSFVMESGGYFRVTNRFLPNFDHIE